MTQIYFNIKFSGLTVISLDYSRVEIAVDARQPPSRPCIKEKLYRVQYKSFATK